ncbi:hypothetical protein ACNAAH_000339 [Escherichia coli]
MDNSYKPSVNNKFDTDKLLKFFKTHTNKNGCPECGNEDFDITALRSSDEKTVFVDGVTLKSLPDGLGLISYNKMYMQLTCSNCGYVKFFDMSVIHKRINELYNGD